MSGCYTTVREAATNAIHLVEVTNLYDIRGNEVLNLEQASTFVAALPDGQWLSASVNDFDLYRLH